MIINLTKFSASLHQVRQALFYSKSTLARTDDRLFEQFRNSAIQCFECAWDTAYKCLKRSLEEYLPREDIATMDYKDVLRSGAQYGLIDEPTAWYRFRQLRNKSSHNYDEVKAEEVFREIPKFLRHAEFLYEQIEKKNN